MPYLHKDCFEVKTFENQQMQRLSLNFLYLSKIRSSSKKMELS